MLSRKFDAARTPKNSAKTTVFQHKKGNNNFTTNSKIVNPILILKAPGYPGDRKRDNL